MWKGAAADYGSIHQWLDRNFGHQKKRCQECKNTKNLDWALKKGKKHNHKRENYFVLCRSHHLKYDYTIERKQKISRLMSDRKIEWGAKISKSLKAYHRKK